LQPTYQAQSTSASLARTPDEKAGGARFAVLLALLLGIAALAFGPSMPGLAQRLKPRRAAPTG
jgi:hypothetical protein